MDKLLLGVRLGCLKLLKNALIYRHSSKESSFFFCSTLTVCRSNKAMLIYFLYEVGKNHVCLVARFFLYSSVIPCQWGGGFSSLNWRSGKLPFFAFFFRLYNSNAIRSHACYLKCSPIYPILLCISTVQMQRSGEWKGLTSSIIDVKRGWTW